MYVFFNCLSVLLTFGTCLKCPLKQRSVLDNCWLYFLFWACSKYVSTMALREYIFFYIFLNLVLCRLGLVYG